MTLGPEKRLFLELVDLDADARAEALAALPDPAARARLEGLLEAHDRASEDDVVESLVESSRSIDRTGETIGRFRLLRRLASGGMGVVYEAEQDSPRRSVAVKLLQAGAGRETVRRFEHEAEVLGQLQHPGIARVYEAGVAPTSSGTCPYLALELIDGEPLDQYAERAGLDTGARLDVLAQICDAVAHAHMRGIIHRDLKPANILVEKGGQPKVLDFGIARLRNDGGSLQTRTGQVLGTLPYMSPEQVDGDPNTVDTRTDVYALGVIAFQLLGGRMPLDLEGKTLMQAAATIREVEPPMLGSLDARLRGDLETVVAKALRKEPEERYPGAAELGADLRRYLRHEPIVARQPTAIYQIRKLVRRHRPWFAGAAAVFVALVAGLIMTILERDRARAAEGREFAARQAAEKDAERANTRADAMGAVTAVAQEILRRASPTVTGSSEVDLALAVREASATVAERLDGRPEVEGPIHGTIGTLWLNLADHKRATHHLELAEKAFRSAEFKDPANHARTLQSLGGVAAAQSDFDASCSYLEKAREIAATLPEAQRGLLAGILSDLAFAEHRRKRPKEALQLAARSAELSAALDGRESTPYAKKLKVWATILADLNNWAEARRHLETAVAIYDAKNSQLPEAADAMRDLGWALWRNGVQTEAVRMIERAADRMRGVFSNPHPNFARCLKLLADIYARTGKKAADTEPLYAEALRIYDAVFFESNSEVEKCRRDLGLARCSLGDKSGVELVRQSLKTVEAKFDEGDANVMAALQAMVEAYRRIGQPKEAVRFGAQMIERLEKVHGKKSKRLAIPLVRQSYAHRDLRQFAPAEAAMRRVVEIQVDALGADHPTTLMYRCMLGRAMSDAGRHEDALGELVGTVAKLSKKLPANHHNLNQMQDLLEAVYRKAGRTEDADALRKRRSKGGKKP